MKMSSMRYVFLDVTASGRGFAELYHSANHENREALKQYVSWLSPADGSTTYASIARVIVNWEKTYHSRTTSPTEKEGAVNERRILRRVILILLKTPREEWVFREHRPQLRLVTLHLLCAELEIRYENLISSLWSRFYHLPVY